jgi:hypothetical protein
VYITNRHHLAAALVASGRSLDKHQLTINVTTLPGVGPSSDLPTFLSAMLSAQLLWLGVQTNAAGVNPLLLPTTVSACVDDPFRALAWYVRRNGGYNETDVPFQDFYWADFFRSNLSVEPVRGVEEAAGYPGWSWCTVAPYSGGCFNGDSSWIQSVLGQALSLAQSSAASNLPGFGPGTKDPPSC